MADNSMTKSELIDRIVAAQTQVSGSQLTSKDVELAVKTMIEQMSHTLASGDRIEIRGFGSFSLHYRAPRIGRNPKTGESVGLAGKHVPHFKPGKELRDRVNNALLRETEAKKAESLADGGSTFGTSGPLDGAQH
jgi:integration host factor subunit beta